MVGKSNYPTIPDNASIVTARSSWQIMYLYFLRPILVFLFFLFSSIYFSLYITSILFSFTFSSIAFLFTNRHIFCFLSLVVKYFFKVYVFFSVYSHCKFVLLVLCWNNLSLSSALWLNFLSHMPVYFNPLPYFVLYSYLNLLLYLLSLSSFFLFPLVPSAKTSKYL